MPLRATDTLAATSARLLRLRRISVRVAVTIRGALLKYGG